MNYLNNKLFIIAKYCILNMNTSAQNLKVLKFHDDGIFKKLPRILPKLPVFDTLELNQEIMVADSESTAIFDFKMYHSNELTLDLSDQLQDLENKFRSKYLAPGEN